MRRAHPWQSNRSSHLPRGSETLGLLYADHFPYRQIASSRGVRHWPVHEQLAARAVYLAKSRVRRGRTGSFRRKAAPGQARDADTWGRPRWHKHVAAEQWLPEGIGLFDLSPFGKIHVEGAMRRPCCTGLRQRDRRRPGADRLYAEAESSGRHRGRPHGDPPHGDNLPHRNGGRHTSPRYLLA